MIQVVGPHIPKTGGTTTRVILNMAFGEEAVHIVEPTLLAHPDYRANPTDHPEDFARYNEDRLRAPVEIVAPNKRCIVGHMVAGTYRAKYPDAKWFTFLRNPINRLLSLYWSIPELRTRPFIEFCRIPGLQNQVSRVWLRGMDISEFDFVGVTEHLADDLRALGKQFGFPVPEKFALCPVIDGKPGTPMDMDLPMPLFRITTEGAYHAPILTKDEVAEITELNAEDMLMYAKALQMRTMIMPMRTLRETQTREVELCGSA